jgi:hypothetical protein
VLLQIHARFIIKRMAHVSRYGGLKSRYGGSKLQSIPIEKCILQDSCVRALVVCFFSVFSYIFAVIHALAFLIIEKE